MQLCTPMAIGMPPAPHRASSSQAMTVNRWSAPWPPYAGSYSRPSRPSSPSFGKSSCAGKMPAFSQSSTWGTISRSTTSRTILRNALCASVNRIRTVWQSGLASSFADPVQLRVEQRESLGEQGVLEDGLVALVGEAVQGGVAGLQLAAHLSGRRLALAHGSEQGP